MFYPLKARPHSPLRSNCGACPRNSLAIYPRLPGNLPQIAWQYHSTCQAISPELPGNCKCGDSPRRASRFSPQVEGALSKQGAPSLRLTYSFSRRLSSQQRQETHLALMAQDIGYCFCPILSRAYPYLLNFSLRCDLKLSSRI